MKHLGRIARVALAAATLFAASASSLPAQSMSRIQADLAGPVQVLLDNGNRQGGTIASWDGESLRLEVELGGGSAEMTFQADEIRDISFPGNQYLSLLGDWVNDPDRVEDALGLFRAFYQQRGAYLRYMDEGELSLFVRYARYALEQGEPLRAVAMIEVLRPYIDDEALLDSLDDAVLLGFFLGGMREQAQTQAAKWIESAEPSGGSALGWRILAEIHFANEAYEEALWTALKPVAFSNQMPMEHLAACYAFAIAAASETRQEALQQRLAEEMETRDLTWPTDIALLADYADTAKPMTDEEEEDDDDDDDDDDDEDDDDDDDDD